MRINRSIKFDNATYPSKNFATTGSSPIRGPDPPCPLPGYADAGCCSVEQIYSISAVTDGATIDGLFCKISFLAARPSGSQWDTKCIPLVIIKPVSSASGRTKYYRHSLRNILTEIGWTENGTLALCSV